MKHLYTYLIICFILVTGQAVLAQTQKVKFFSKSGTKEVPPTEAYYFEIEEENEKGGGTRTRYLAEDSSKVYQYSYSDLDGGKYKTGILDGPYYAWYKNGKLKSQIDYKDNKFSGEYKGWYESGQLRYRRNYNDELPQDTLIALYENGAVRRVEVYEKDKLVSGKLLDEAGKEIEFFPMEQMPQFPGGEQRMLNWLGTNITYPKSTRKADAEGRVIISFIVGKDGKIKDAEVIQGFHPAADAEALRVVNKMPKWQPGLQEGEPVAVRYTLPHKFSFK